MRLQRIECVEQAAERIVDLVRHAGSEPPEARQLLFLGELHGEVRALALGMDQGIVAAEQACDLEVARPGISRDEIGSAAPCAAARMWSSRTRIGPIIRLTSTKPPSANKAARTPLVTSRVTRISRRSANRCETSKVAWMVPIGWPW